MGSQMRGAVIALAAVIVVEGAAVVGFASTGSFTVHGPLGTFPPGAHEVQAAPMRIKDAQTCSYFGTSLGREHGWWWNDENQTCYVTDDQGNARPAEVAQ